MRLLSFIKNSFFSQLTLFTIIPSPKHKFIPYQQSAWASPLIGILIGLFIALPIHTIYIYLYDLLILNHFETNLQIDDSIKIIESFALLALCSTFAIILQIIITGAIHEDGLADCSDALLQSGYESRWKVSHDPHTGVFGVISIVLIIVLRLFIYSLLLSNLIFIYALPLAFAVSRIVPVAISFIFKHHKKSSSMKRFGKNNNFISIIIATLIGLTGVIYFFGWVYGIIILLLHNTAVIFNAWLLSSFHNGLNGDQLGVLIIISEIIILIFYLFFNYSLA